MTLAASGYKTKKSLKEAVGQRLNYNETSLFGPEYKRDGEFCVVGPSAHERKWFATVKMVDGLIAKVS
jgi:hypothetical protein